MPKPAMANAAIVDLEPAIDALHTAIHRLSMTHLPPWTSPSAFTRRDRAVEGARLLFHRTLSEYLAWTPKTMSSEHVHWMPSAENDPEGGAIDRTLLGILRLYDLEAIYQQDHGLAELPALAMELEQLIDELIVPLIHYQLCRVIGPFVYHAWHAIPLGTAYVLQAGGIMVLPKQLMRDMGDRDLADLDVPVEVNLAEHWCAAGRRDRDPLEEAQIRVDGDVVSEDPAVVSSFICEEIRKHPNAEASLQAHVIAQRSRGTQATQTKLTMIQEAYRRQASTHVDPVIVGPSVPAESMASETAVQAVLKGALKERRVKRLRAFPGHSRV